MNLDDEVEFDGSDAEELEAVEETVEETPDESDEDTTDWRAEALKQRAINARLAKKANKPPVAPVEQIQQTNASVDADELRLIARGLSDEEIAKAKVIAKGNDISLTDALKDDLFIAFQEKQKEEKRKAKAKLGASRTSSETEENGITEGMSRDDHKKLFNELQGG